MVSWGHIGLPIANINATASENVFPVEPPDAMALCTKRERQHSGVLETLVRK
ncbi:MAG: hypothetical protein AB3N20_00245 [Rhizobiaceae bacterium]